MTTDAEEKSKLHNVGGRWYIGWILALTQRHKLLWFYTKVDDEGLADTPVNIRYCPLEAAEGFQGQGLSLHFYDFVDGSFTMRVGLPEFSDEHISHGRSYSTVEATQEQLKALRDAIDAGLHASANDRLIAALSRADDPGMFGSLYGF